MTAHLSQCCNPLADDKERGQMFSFRNGVYKSLSHIMLIEIPQTSALKFFWWLICIINSVDNTKVL